MQVTDAEFRLKKTRPMIAGQIIIKIDSILFGRLLARSLDFSLFVCSRSLNDTHSRNDLHGIRH